MMPEAKSEKEAEVESRRKSEGRSKDVPADSEEEKESAATKDTVGFNNYIKRHYSTKQIVNTCGT